MLSEIWPDTKPVAGMIHLLPLPGSPGWGGSMEEVLDRAAADAAALADGGVDGVLVENFLDHPFFPSVVPPEVVASMSLIVSLIRSEIDLPVGVNVLRNDARSALGIAVATGAEFIRVNVHTGVMFTDQGMLEGQAHDTLRSRRDLGVKAAILADIMVKHAVPPTRLSLTAAARDCWKRGGPDGIILTGGATGSSTSLDEVRRVRESLPDARLWIGSGVTQDTVGEALEVADGAIVGSAFKRDGRPESEVDLERVKRLMERARGQ